MAVFVLYCVVAGLVVIALYLLAVIAINGVLAIFKECFAAYFYGAHYPELGDRLEPPPPAAPAMPEPPPPPVGTVPVPPPVW
jgi:protein TonB